MLGSNHRFSDDILHTLSGRTQSCVSYSLLSPYFPHWPPSSSEEPYNWVKLSINNVELGDYLKKYEEGEHSVTLRLKNKGQWLGSSLSRSFSGYSSLVPCSVTVFLLLLCSWKVFRVTDELCIWIRELCPQNIKNLSSFTCSHVIPNLTYLLLWNIKFKF